MRLCGRNVTCVRGGRDIFAGLDFEISSGSALAVTGPNGAGKSSLLRIVAGLLSQAAGEVILNGGSDDLTLAEQSHYLGHRDPIKGALTVRENLEFWKAFLGGETAAGADESLAAVRLAHAADLPAAFLSAGQRRRLSIARLLAVRRPIWLLDEPVSALDAEGQNLFTALMRAHLGDGGIVLAATHGPLGIPANELRIGEAA
ncbi:MAG TPA: heme ABC exporter ATP-binding protein CcmA [Afipia sp.]